MLFSSCDKLGNDFGGNGLVLADPGELALRLSHEPICPPLCWSRQRLSSRLSHLSRLWSPNLLLRSQTQQGTTHSERLPRRIQNP